MRDGVHTAQAPRDSLAERAPTLSDLYLDLLKKCLTRSIFEERGERYRPRRGGWREVVFERFERILGAAGLELIRRVSFDEEARAEGRDWPADAETMIGLRRLDHLQHCIDDVIRCRVPGDLIETGVWRGGAAIFMRGALDAFGDTERIVWAADSFQGLPKPNADDYPHDKEDAHWTQPSLAVTLAEVRNNFDRYGCLDERVRFVPGWFSETLPEAPIRRLAVLRLDGDLYESTIVALRSLYPKLSVGGYVIVDDYALANCKAAVDEFRAERGITEPMERVDWTCIFWRRAR
jgi:O-methyltransferase